MPFVIRFQTCNVEMAERPDLFAGVPVPAPVAGGLTAAEKQAVRDRLRAGGAVGPDGLGRYRVVFPGGQAEADFPNLTGDGRCVGGTLTAAAASPALVRLAFEVARDGNLLLMPDGVRRPVAPTAGHLLRVALRWPSTVVVPTPAHLWALVAPPPPAPEPEPPKKKPRNTRNTRKKRKGQK